MLSLGKYQIQYLVVFLFDLPAVCSLPFLTSVSLFWLGWILSCFSNHSFCVSHERSFSSLLHLLWGMFSCFLLYFICLRSYFINIPMKFYFFIPDLSPLSPYLLYFFLTPPHECLGFGPHSTRAKLQSYESIT